MSTFNKAKRFRWAKHFHRTLIAFIAILVAFGAVKIIETLQPETRIGHFRSKKGFEEYQLHYSDALAEMPTPARTQTIATTYGDVRVYEWETPETKDTIPIILLPGRASGVPMWSENLNGFASKHRVIAVDAIGDAGLSIQRLPLTTAEEQGAWINEVVSEVAPHGAHIVGHSFGGSTATIYARTHPNNVVSLTLLEPAFTFGYPPISVFLWGSMTQLPGLPKSIREYALGKISGTEYSDTTAVARMINTAATEYSSNLPTPTPLTEHQAQTLTMPVYVALASDSKIVGVQDTTEVTALLPHAMVKRWEHTTHSLPMEVAKPLTSELEAFWHAAEKNH